MKSNIELQPMNIGQPEKSTEVVTFEEIHLSSLVWGPDKAKSGEKMTTLRSEQTITIGGKLFRLRGTCLLLHPEPNQVDRIRYFFAVKPADPDDNNELAFAILTIRPDPTTTELVAETNIERPDRALLPPKFGLALDNKLLDFIATLPKTKPIKHIVIRQPRTGDEADWNRRFLPMLIDDRHYTDHQDGTFTKVYEPPVTS